MTRVKFWGVRGSLPSHSERYGGQTSCVEVVITDRKSLFLDAGSGLRVATQGRSFDEVVIFLSHFHWDHIQGLPYAAFWETPATKITFISPFLDLRARIEALFDPRFHPVDLLKTAGPRVQWKVVSVGEEWNEGGLRCRASEITHPGQSFCLRLDSARASLLYATDSDYRGLSAQSLELFQRVDFGILDSQYLVGDELQKADYGHASFKTAIDQAVQSLMKTAILFHYDPGYSDEDLDEMRRQAEAYARSRPGGEELRVMMAKEGSEVEL